MNTEFLIGATLVTLSLGGTLFITFPKIPECHRAGGRRTPVNDPALDRRGIP